MVLHLVSLLMGEKKVALKLKLACQGLWSEAMSIHLSDSVFPVRKRVWTYWHGSLMIHKTFDGFFFPQYFNFNDSRLGDNRAIVYSLLSPVLSFFYTSVLLFFYLGLNSRGMGVV